MNRDQEGTWRRLVGGTKVKLVSTGVAVLMATSLQVMAQSGNNNVQRGGYNPAANHQDGDSGPRSGNNNVQRGDYNPAANHQDGDNIRRGSNNNIQRGGYNPAANHQDGDNIRSGGNINIQRGDYNPAANHQDGDVFARRGTRNGRANKRWDYRLDNRRRYQTYNKYRNNWNDQRTYLQSNLAYFNQLAQLDRARQAQLDAQMRAAYLAYHNNQWNGPYGWDSYSDPLFLDYLQSNNPSVLQTILAALDLGADDGYLYSSNWGTERSQLARNMARIHQLALDGRITPDQERALLAQLRAQFMAYHGNRWDRTVGWSQYSDPRFVDYLNTRNPSLLMTIRAYLVR